MEGKYIIHMPKGTTPRTRKILEQQQAAKGTGLGGVRRHRGCLSLGRISLALAEKQALTGSWGPWAKQAMKVAIGAGVGHHLRPRVPGLVSQACPVPPLALFLGWEGLDLVTACLESV